ncbi:MAG: hypothetical protein V3575_04110, partial [Candidatus Absconditabacteria bacterium]
MYFETTGLKQVGTDETAKQEKIQLLFEAETIEEINLILKFLGIVKLNAKVFDYSVEEFGSIIFQIDIKGILYKGIIKKGTLQNETIKDGYYYTKNILGVDVDLINNLINPVEEETVKEVISKIREAENQKNTENKTIKSRQEKQIDDKKLLELKEFISANLIEADELIEKVSNKISPIVIKHGKEIIDELKKLRMGSNIEKLTINFEKLINYMETIEIEYLEVQKKQEIGEQKSTIVTDLDIVKEYNKYSKSQKKQKASQFGKLNLEKDDVYYKFMGKPGIFLRLLGKDTIYKLKEKTINSDESLYDLIKYTEIFVIFIRLELNLYFLYSYFICNSVVRYFNYIRPIGLLGLIIFFLKYLALPDQIEHGQGCGRDDRGQR